MLKKTLKPKPRLWPRPRGPPADPEPSWLLVGVTDSIRVAVIIITTDWPWPALGFLGWVKAKNAESHQDAGKNGDR
jgi:hypothetical protein